MSDVRHQKSPVITMESLQKLVAFTALAWVGIANAAPLQDADLDRALQGAWCNSDDGGQTCWGYDQFSRGKSTFCAAIPETGQVLSGTSKYEIRGNRICHVVTAINDESLYEVGERACFIVLDISADEQRFRSVDESKINTMYRVEPTNIRCPKGGI